MKAISHNQALDFMRAGKAIMTIESKETGKHFTYQFKTPKHDEEKSDDLKARKDLPVWVRVLRHGDNTGKYTFIGTIFGNTYYHSKTKTSITEDATSVKAFKYWLKGLTTNNEEMLNKIELYHEGICMKCGRKLTTPESVEEGIGPVCSDWIKRQKMIRDKKVRHALEIAGINPKDCNQEEIEQMMGFILDKDGLWS